MMIKISILMSIYREKDDYLKQSLESVINQSFKEFELIIIDDGMTEQNLKTVETLSDSRIKVIKNEVNLGLTKSLNKAASFAKGEYLARLDSDDWCEPTRLEKQLQFLSSHSDHVMCGSKTLELSPKDNKLLSPKTTFIKDDLEIKKSLSSFNPFVHSSLFMRKKEFELINGYDTSYRYAQDYNLVLKMAKIGKLHNLEEVLVYRHLDDNNISHKKKKAQSYYALKSRLKAYAEYGGGIVPLLHILKTIISFFIPTPILIRLKR